MKRVVEIPDNYDLSRIQNGSIASKIVLEAVKKGKTLPKGHGRLIDADYLKNVILLHNFHGNNRYIVPYSDRRGYRLRQREVDEGIINAPTIIEAGGGDAK